LFRRQVPTLMKGILHTSSE